MELKTINDINPDAFYNAWSLAGTEEFREMYRRGHIYWLLSEGKLKYIRFRRGTRYAIKGQEFIDYLIGGKY